MGDRYNPLFELGAGAFGKAWVVKDNVTQKKHVSKVIQIKGLSSTALDRCITEVTVLSACSHANIVRYIEAFVNDGSLHIIMEYASGGDLMQKIEKQKGVWFPVDTILDWFLQIVLALEYIHSKNILHRDLKPQNVFLTQHGIVKLGDFGIARVLNDCDDLALTRIGTPFYISPEICERKPYNSSSDMWSAGCLLYQICLLHVPFEACNFDELSKKIVKAEYKSIPRNFGSLIPHLISKLLVINPSNRITAKELLNLADVQEMLVFVKKKNLTLRKGQRSRSSSIVSQRSRLKEDDKIRSNSVDHSCRNKLERLKPVDICTKDKRPMVIKSNVKKGTHINTMAGVKPCNAIDIGQCHDKPSVPEKVENSKKDAMSNCSERPRIDISKQERLEWQCVEHARRKDTIVESPAERIGLSENDEELRKQGKTFMIRDSLVRKLSEASPKLAQTICKQRFSLSVSEPDSLHQNKSIPVDRDDVVEIDADIDEVFSSPCVNLTTRNKINSLTYNITDKDKRTINNNNNNNSDKSELVYDKIEGLNNVMLQALSAISFNKELSKNILYDEIVRKTSKPRCDYLLKLVQSHIIEKGLSVQSLNSFLQDTETMCIPLIAMYLSLL